MIGVAPLKLCRSLLHFFKLTKKKEIDNKFKIEVLAYLYEAKRGLWMLKVSEGQRSHPSHPRTTFPNLPLPHIWGAELARAEALSPFSPSLPPPRLLQSPPTLPLSPLLLSKEIHTDALFKNAFLKATFRTDNRCSRLAQTLRERRGRQRQITSRNSSSTYLGGLGPRAAAPSSAGGPGTLGSGTGIVAPSSHPPGGGGGGRLLAGGRGQGVL